MGLMVCGRRSLVVDDCRVLLPNRIGSGDVGLC